MRHTSASRKPSGGWVAVVAMLLTFLSAPALAKPPGRRIAVLPSREGTAKDAVITTKLAKVLKQQKIQVVSGAPVKAALAKGGVPMTDGDWLDLARRLKVDGMVESTLSGSGARRRVEVVVHNGADGSVVARATFAAQGGPAQLAAPVAAGFWKKLGAAVRETTRPQKGDGPGTATRRLPSSETGPVASEPEPAPAAGEPPTGESETEREDAKEAKAEAPQADRGERKSAESAATASKRRASAGREGEEEATRPPRSVEIELGGRVLRRAFKFAPASAGTGHTQGLMPTLLARAAWFPILHAGIFFSAEYNPVLKTNTTPAFPAGTRELIIGAQGRYPLSFGWLGLGAAYFQHLFIASDTSDENDAPRTSLAWPNVAYQGVRIAASGRFRVTDVFQIGVEAAYRLVTTPGSGSLRVRSPYYFPNGKASYGLDGSAFVAAAVLSWLEIRLAADYRRYGFGALEPGSDNASGTRATGASDDYLGFVLSAVGVYGGK